MIMTVLRTEPYVIPAADLGPENPLPAFRSQNSDREMGSKVDAIPEEDRPGLGWATGFRVLPYRLQDGFNRHRTPRAFFSVVLENEYLKVRILPEIGGQVTSILHKPSGTELLECNPVFQPGNLALRNAWVSGGIEWNTAQIGHHYLTCSPLHTARVTGLHGEPAVRLYAWDRVKCFPFQVDLILPPHSPFLYARVRLINPHDYELPMYWWTNIGVSEREGRRVLCPADTAFEGLKLMDLPMVGGTDATYATNMRRSYDLFFRIPRSRRPWIAIVSPDGTGLVHASTDRLIGRKMFAWGMGPGPRRWQEYLSTEGHVFQEIQAGLARTQDHSVPMPANTQWAWTEALGYFRTDPAKVHSEDWQEAYGEGERVLAEMLPRDQLEESDRMLAEVTTRAPDELLFRGLGWGALERRRLAAMDLPDPIPQELVFDAADIGDEQAPWLALLESAHLPERHPGEDPGHYVVQEDWRDLLQQSISDGKGDNWLTWLHLGVMDVEHQDPEAAKEAFERSLQRAPNGWALRNLAMLALREQDAETACELLGQAWDTGPRIASLAVEYGGLLMRLERYDALRDFISALPEDIRSHDRIRLMSVRIAIINGRYGEAERLLDYDFVTVREGEVSLTDLWFELHARRMATDEGIEMNDELLRRAKRQFPPPARIDFRMWVDKADTYVSPQAQAESSQE